MKVTRIIAAVAMSTVLAGTAQAQQNCTGTTTTRPANCSVTHNVQTNVPFVARLTLSTTTSTLTAPIAENFGVATGISDANVLSLDVKSNAGFKITASAQTASWTGGSGSKSAADLRVTVDNFATSTALSTTGVALATETAATAGKSYSIGYNVVYNWVTDTPGAYALAVNYTLTAP